MFDELNDYSFHNHFFFSINDELGMVCNAPTNGGGVYLVYELKNGKISLNYVGSSGKILQNGSFKSRKGGIYDRIVNGKQFEDVRHRSWKAKMIKENIEALDIYWYQTFNKEHFDIPANVEGKILQRYFDIYGALPKWNQEF